jgi:hypothetical protein
VRCPDFAPNHKVVAFLALFDAWKQFLLVLHHLGLASHARCAERSHSARLSDLGKDKTGCQYYLSGLRSLDSAVCPFATSAAASEKSAAGRNAGDSCRHSFGLNAAIF